MTNKEIIEDLEQRELEICQYCHLLDRNNHLHVLVWNDLVIMRAMKAILTNIEEGKEQLIKRTEV